MEVDPWFSAAVTGDVRFIARNYLSNAKRIEPNPPYQTAMMKAADNHNLSIVKLLLSHEKRMTTPEGWTALMGAARNGFTDIVEALLPYEAGFRTLTTVFQYKPNTTALLLAATYGHTSIVKTLYNSEAELSGWTPLFLAAYNADFSTLNEVFSENPGLFTGVAPRDNYNRTPLMYLVMHRRDTLPRHDLGRCIKLLAKTQEGAQDSYGRTALMYAVLAGNLDSVKYILDLTTAEVNKHTYVETESGLIVAGKTALMLAVETQNYAICDALSRYEIGRTTQSGVTALMLAAYHGNQEICKLLAPYESSFTTISTTPDFPVNSTALSIAKHYNHYDIVASLSCLEGEDRLKSILPKRPPSPERITGSLFYSSLYSNIDTDQSSMKMSVPSLKMPSVAPATSSHASSITLQTSGEQIQPVIIPISSPSVHLGANSMDKSGYPPSSIRLSGEQRGILDDSALLLRRSDKKQSQTSSSRPKSAVLPGIIMGSSPVRPMTISELEWKSRDPTTTQEVDNIETGPHSNTDGLDIHTNSSLRSILRSTKGTHDSHLQLEIENAALNRKLHEADKKIAELYSSNRKISELQSELDLANKTIRQKDQYINTLEHEKSGTIQKIAREKVHDDIESIIKRLSVTSSPTGTQGDLRQSTSNIELENLRADLDDKSTQLQAFQHDISNLIYPMIYEIQSRFTNSHLLIEQKVKDITNKLHTYQTKMQRFIATYTTLHRDASLKGHDLSVNDLINGSLISTTEKNSHVSLSEQLFKDQVHSTTEISKASLTNLELAEMRQKIKTLEQENAILRERLPNNTANSSLSSGAKPVIDSALVPSEQNNVFILSKLEETNNRLKAIESILAILKEKVPEKKSIKVASQTDPSLTRTLTALEGELTLLKSSIGQLDNSTTAALRDHESESITDIEADILGELDKNLRETRVFDEKFSQLRAKVLSYKECVQREKQQNESLTEKLSKLTVELELTTRQLQAAQVEVQALKQAKEEDDARNDSILRRRDEELEKLRHKLKTMDDVEREMSKLKTDNALLENKLENLQKELSVSTAELNGKERQLSEETRSMQAMNIKYQHLIAENNALIKEKAELERKAECLLQEYDSLQEEMKALLSKSANMEENIKMMSTELKMVHEGNQEETKMLKKQLADMTASLEEHEENSKVMIGKLETNLRISNDKLTALQSENDISRGYVEKAKEYIQNADALLNSVIVGRSE